MDVAGSTRVLFCTAHLADIACVIQLNGLRLLHISPVFTHPTYRKSGVSKTTFDLAYALASLDHDVRVVSPLTDLRQSFEPPSDRLWCDGRLEIEYVSKARHTRFGTSSHGLTDALSAHLDWAHLAHIHTFFSPWTDRSARECLVRGVPYIIQPRGKLSPGMMMNRGLAKQFYLWVTGNGLLRKAAAVVPLTESVATTIRSRDPRITVEVCPNGLDPAEYNVPVEDSPIDDPYILYLGMLDPRKRIDLLIDAFALASPRLPGVKLALVGGDNYGIRSGLERHVARHNLTDRVVLPGHVAGEQKLCWLRHALLFALCSEAEGLSVAMIEALACGLPCLLSPGCNAPEVENVGAGQTLPWRAEEWSNAMVRWLTDERARDEASANARALFADRYTIQKVAQTFTAIYQRAAA